MADADPTVPAGCELVRASSLRTGDIIVASGGQRFGLISVERVGQNIVKLRSWVIPFTVLARTRFVRVHRNRQIDTRPELRH